MSSGNWENLDSLNLQYGTQKAFTENAGDFVAYGDVRQLEITLPLAQLVTSTTSLFPVSMNTFFPSGGNIIVEHVTVVMDTPAVGSSAALNVGLGYFSNTVSSYNTFSVVESGQTWSLSYPQMTAITSTAFISALSGASMSTAGGTINIYPGSTAAGAYVGTSVPTQSVATYITAGVTGATFSSGVARIRIFYRGLGTISQ